VWSDFSTQTCACSVRSFTITSTTIPVPPPGQALVVPRTATTYRQPRAVTSSRKVVLNLSGVSYIDSGGLGTLVGVYSSARAAGADIKLTGLGQRLRDVLQITKLATVFEVYETEQQAIAACQSSG